MKRKHRKKKPSRKTPLQNLKEALRRASRSTSGKSAGSAGLQDGVPTFNSKPTQQHPAVARMNPRLASRFAKVKPIWAREITAFLLWCHFLGRSIGKAIDDKQKYGMDAIGILSHALGTSKSFLVACVELARTWTTDEIREIAEKTDLYGRPITFGHLTLIVKEEEAGRRRVLIGDVFRQGLTVQELAARIDKRSRRKGQVSRRSVKANVDKVMQRASRYLDTQGGSNEEIVELLAEQIVHGEVPSDTLVELAGDLAVIRLQYKTVVQSAQWTVDRLGQLNRELT